MNYKYSRIARNTVFAAALVATPALAFAYNGANGFIGPYVGAQIGINNSSAYDLNTTNSLTGGGELGYNVAAPLGRMETPLVFGGDVFGELNAQGSHNHHVDYGSDVFGVDFLAGYPIGAAHELMPYVKLGVGRVNGTGDLGGHETGLRAGLGAELRLNNAVGLTGQWMHQENNHISNNNFTVGVNYHFDRR